jgi:hypothetical protein
MTRTKPELGRPTALAHLNDDARRGRVFSTAIAVLAYLVAVLPNVAYLGELATIAAILGAVCGVICLVLIVEGRGYGALGACAGGLVGPGLRVAMSGPNALGTVGAVAVAAGLLIAVETATHASRYRSVAPPTGATSRRRIIATVQTTVLSGLGAYAIVIGAALMSRLPIKEGLVAGVIGLGAVIIGLWLSVGDLDRVVAPEPQSAADYLANEAADRPIATNGQ